MRQTLAALLAAAAAACATPAAACGFYGCVGRALADDAYPPGDPGLSPALRYVVAARDGKGLSLAGFYNDPSLALAEPGYGPVGYGYAPSPAVAADYAYRRPHVIYGPRREGAVLRRAY